MVVAFATSGIADFQRVFVWCGVLIALVIAAFVGYSYLRRWMRSTDESPARGFTLGDLRDLHRQGKMTDAEFQAARDQIVGQAKRMADAMPPVLPRPPTRPPPPSDPA